VLFANAPAFGWDHFVSADDRRSASYFGVRVAPSLPEDERSFPERNQSLIGANSA